MVGKLEVVLQLRGVDAAAKCSGSVCGTATSMPTDGEALVAFIAGCSAPGENAAAWTSKIRDASNSYFNRVGSHRKTGKTGSGGFSAADAKKEAGNLVKIANSSLKQQVCQSLPKARSVRAPRLHASHGRASTSCFCIHPARCADSNPRSVSAPLPH